MLHRLCCLEMVVPDGLGALENQVIDEPADTVCI